MTAGEWKYTLRITDIDTGSSTLRKLQLLVLEDEHFTVSVEYDRLALRNP